jgi:hypothetical protein
MFNMPLPKMDTAEAVMSQYAAQENGFMLRNH